MRSLTHRPDPLHVLGRRSPPNKRPSHSRSTSFDPSLRSEKLDRERSIRSNRRQKFIDCISAEDVNIASLRKLAWNGVPGDLRPIVWPLLLVSVFAFGRFMDVECLWSVIPHFPCLYEYLPSRGNGKSTSALSSLPFPADERTLTSKYGIKLRLMFLERDLAYSYGCRQLLNEWVSIFHPIVHVSSFH